MQEYGLLGNNISYSFSPKLHSMIGEYRYDLFDLDIDKAKDFLIKKDFKGINVTIPYKEFVIDFCDELDISAQKIGVVNTILNKKGKLIGYNTDYYAVIEILKKFDLDYKISQVLILGNGATSKTVSSALEYLGTKNIDIISRKMRIHFNNYIKGSEFDLIINCTPCGMYPNNMEKMIDISNSKTVKYFFDLVYNPLQTLTMLEAIDNGVICENGLEMLVRQAIKSAEIFLGDKINSEEILNKLKKHFCNIVLIGMPGSGKTTIGKKLSLKLNKDFKDTDEEIEKEYGSIKNIFAEKGEDFFRNIESENIKKIGKDTNQIISTGGGVVVRDDNYYHLKQNSIIIYIKRDLSQLEISERPLLKNGMADLLKLYEERKNLYEKFADSTVENQKDISETVEKICSIFENNL